MKSAVTENAEQKYHNIPFDNVKILDKESNTGKGMIKEAIEIDMCPANFYGEYDWKISNTWKPIIHNLKRKQQEGAS